MNTTTQLPEGSSERAQRTGDVFEPIERRRGVTRHAVNSLELATRRYRHSGRQLEVEQINKAVAQIATAETTQPAPEAITRTTNPLFVDTAGEARIVTPAEEDIRASIESIHATISQLNGQNND